MKFGKLCTLLIMWLALVMLNAAPAQAKLFGEDNLKADFNGDGRIETVKLLRNSSNDGLRAALYDSAGNMLWISEENYFNKYTSCFVADIDCDGVPELVFSGGGSTEHPSLKTVVLRWKNRKFTSPAGYYIQRSPRDTTEYFWNTEFNRSGRHENGKYSAAVSNLRKVGAELWGDVLIRENNNSYSERVIGRTRLIPCADRGESVLKGAEIRGCCNANLPLMAFPFAMSAVLKADLNGDGKLETVSFKSYYPATGEGQHYRITVSDEAGNKLWESGRREGKAAQDAGGLSILFDNNKDALSSGFISDIDGDGYKELVASTWARGGDRIEIWRWRDGAFHFVGKTRLMRSADDANAYLFVDPDNVDNDSRLYVKVRYDPECDFSWKEHVSVSNLRMRNGEIWGISAVGSGGSTAAAVKLKPCKGGFRVVQTVPHDSVYW